MNGLTRWVDAPARILMSSLFLVSGVGKLVAVAATQQYMTAHAVPGLLLWPAALFEISSGVMLAAGFQVRPLSLVLAGWCVLTAAIFHTAFGDQVQQVMFLKNMVMAGGFLILASHGAPGGGIDGRRHGPHRSS
jgi:putative oxidoreductase